MLALHTSGYTFNDGDEADHVEEEGDAEGDVVTYWASGEAFGIIKPLTPIANDASSQATQPADRGCATVSTSHSGRPRKRGKDTITSMYNNAKLKRRREARSAPPHPTARQWRGCCNDALVSNIRRVAAHCDKSDAAIIDGDRTQHSKVLV